MAKVSNVSLEIRTVTRYPKKDGSGHLRRFYAAGSISDADVARVDADGKPEIATAGGEISVNFLTPDATMFDCDGKPVVAGCFVEITYALLTRDTDLDGEPSSVKTTGVPVHKVRFTAESSIRVVSGGFSFGEVIGEPGVASDES